MSGRWRSVVAVVLTTGVAGCSFGMKAPEFRPAQRPEGATIRFRTATEAYAGEMIEVRDRSLVVLVEGVLRLVPFDAIRSSSIDQVRGSLAPGDGQRPTAEALAELRLLSRFPYGLAPDVLQRLLDHHNQTALVEVRAPVPSAADGDFIDAARAATARYRDQAAAVLDGYRPIGRDFPAMGRHWIHVTRLFDGELDAAEPEVLNYIDLDGVPVLAGVAYAVPLLAGEAPPEWPVAEAAWHDHAGTLDEETTGTGPHGVHDMGARVAMVHAWIWTANPDGLFAPDNWALPYVRLGLTPPTDAPVAAAKTLSLLEGGGEFVRLAIDEVVSLSDDERAQVRHALSRAVAAAQAIVGEADHDLTAGEITALTGPWSLLWREIDAAAGPGAQPRLAMMAIR